MQINDYREKKVLHVAALIRVHTFWRQIPMNTIEAKLWLGFIGGHTHHTGDPNLTFYYFL